VTTIDQVVLITLTRTAFTSLGVAVGSRVWIRAEPGAPTVTPAATGEPLLPI